MFMVDNMSSFLWCWTRCQSLKNFNFFMRSNRYLPRLFATNEKAKKGTRLTECNTYRQHINAKEFEPALFLYETIKSQDWNSRPELFTSILSVCTKEEHLPTVRKIEADLCSANISAFESLNLALIRCYADAGEIEKALAIVNLMYTDSGIEPRLRMYQPIFDSLCVKKMNPHTAMDLLDVMREKKVLPRSEQVALLIETAVRTKALHDEVFLARLLKNLKCNSEELMGLTFDEMQRIVKEVMQKRSIDEVEDDGILVEGLAMLSKNLLMPPIVSTVSQKFSATSDTLLRCSKSEEVMTLRDSLADANNSMLAVSLACIEGAESAGWNDRIATSDRTFASSLLLADSVDDAISIELKTAKYTIANRISATSEFDRNNSSLLPSWDREPAAATSTLIPSMSLARIVDIDKHTCLCPNCGDLLEPIHLEEIEKTRVRQALLEITATKSTFHHSSLLNFSTWLSNQVVEFTHIIDAANVAYTKQNFDHGRFSYKQVDHLVKELQKRPDCKRVLVVIPRVYVLNVVPNSSRSRRGHRHKSVVSDEDREIIERFERQKMLYVVPGGADDDWYLLFASILPGRTSPCYVVTNDLMRDHKLAFLEPRAFLRWASTQIMRFDFSGAIVDTTSICPNVTFFEPGKFSREIQRTASKRWHFPSIDRQAWLCLKLEE